MKHPVSFEAKRTMKFTDEDFALMYATAIEKPYMKNLLPRAVYTQDGRTFHFNERGIITMVAIFYKTVREEERRLPDYVYDLHLAPSDIYQDAMLACQPQDGYNEAISGMHKLGLSGKVAARMLSDHGIHPPKVAINIWSLHKFTSVSDWIKMNLDKRSEIK